MAPSLAKQIYAFYFASKAKEAMGILRKMKDVNYLGSVGTLNAIFPPLLRCPGGFRVLVVNSVVGLVAPPLRTGYAASKFAQRGFFQALRCEMIDHSTGSAITIAYPGAVRTEINKHRLGLSTDTPSQLVMDKAMDPGKAANIMVNAVAREDRDVLFPLDDTMKGAILSRLLLPICRLFPGVGDRLVLASSRKMQQENSRK